MTYIFKLSALAYVNFTFLPFLSKTILQNDENTFLSKQTFLHISMFVCFCRDDSVLQLCKPGRAGQPKSEDLFQVNFLIKILNKFAISH